MNKLLPLALLLAATCAHAQTVPDWQAKGRLKHLDESDREAARQQHWLDSSRAARAKRRSEIEAYNRTHPAKKPTKSKLR
ncbi:MAG: hypothetical protein ACRYFX_12870 [Janthinobacterium lividum]